MLRSYETDFILGEKSLSKDTSYLKTFKLDPYASCTLPCLHLAR